MPDKPRRRPKFRVVTPSINPTTLPSLSAPNGTYLPPISSPSTSAIGSTGQFGAMLPSGGMGGGTLIPTPAGGVNAMAGTFRNTAPLPQNAIQQPQLAPLGYGNNPLPTNTPTVPKPVQERRGDPAWRALTQNIQNAETDLNRFLTDAEMTGQLNYNLLPSQMDLMTIKTLGLDAADMAELGYVQDPKTLNWMNAQKTGVQPPQGATATQAGPSDEFMSTGFMQYNTENNVAFENQLRWDPIKKKYRKIGQIQSDYGYLPNAKLKTKEEKQLQARREAKNAPQPEQQKRNPSSYTTTSGTFNTATG